MKTALFVLALFVVSLSATDTTSAFTEAMTQRCATTDFADYKTKVNAQRASEGASPIDFTTASTITFKYTSGTYYIYYGTVDPIELSKGSGTYDFYTGYSGVYRQVWNADETFGSSGNIYANPWGYDISCIVDTTNVTYAPSWDIPQVYSSNDNTPPPPTDLCSNIDGTQETMPTGKEDPDNDGVCTDIVVTPPPDPTPPPTGDITFVQKISAVFAFGIGVLIAKQFTFRMYD